MSTDMRATVFPWIGATDASTEGLGGTEANMSPKLARHLFQRAQLKGDKVKLGGVLDDQIPTGWLTLAEVALGSSLGVVAGDSIPGTPITCTAARCVTARRQVEDTGSVPFREEWRRIHRWRMWSGRHHVTPHSLHTSSSFTPSEVNTISRECHSQFQHCLLRH